MTTRCNIIIKQGDSKLILYRHYDGYEIGTGVEIYKLLMSYDRHVSFPLFIGDLLKQRYGNDESIRKENIYEITHCIHGDIDHIYEVEFYEKTRLEEDGFTRKYVGDGVIIRHQQRNYDNSDVFGFLLNPYTLETWKNHLNDLISAHNSGRDTNQQITTL